MAATAFPKVAIPTANSVNGILLTLTACDAVNGNSITATGTERLIIYNSSGGTLTFTITGQADQYGRTANFSRSMATLTYYITPILSPSLWADANGLIQLPSTNAATLLVGVMY